MLTFFLLLLLLLISFGIVFWSISNFISVFAGSPYVSAKQEVVMEALKLSGLKKDEVFYDIGCGKGQTLIEAAKLGAKVFGFEISPYYYIVSKLRTFKNRQIKVSEQNIFSVDFSKADVIYCYLMPSLLKKLSPKFISELKKSARVVSIDFHIEGLKLLKKVKFNKQTIFLYSLSSRSA